MAGIRTTHSRHKARRTPTQERSRATVDALVEAAAQVFEAEGLEATTEAIAARAGVSIGSLYQYFPSKEALLVAIFEAHLGQVEALYRHTAEGLDGGEALEDVTATLVARTFALHRPHPRLHRLLAEEAPLPASLLAHHAGLEADLCAAWARRVPSADDPNAVALTVMALVETLTHRFTLYPVPLDRPPEAFEAHTTAAIVAYVRSMGA